MKLADKDPHYFIFKSESLKCPTGKPVNQAQRIQRFMLNSNKHEFIMLINVKMPTIVQGLSATKPFFWVRNKVRLKSVSSATETS